jgi:hypothetical protein
MARLLHWLILASLRKVRPPSSNQGHFPIHYAIHEQSDHGRDVGRSLSFSDAGG